MTEHEIPTKEFERVTSSPRLRIKDQQNGRAKIFLEETVISTKVAGALIFLTITISVPGVVAWMDIRSRTADRWTAQDAIETEHLRENLNDEIEYIGVTADQMRRIQERNEKTR